MRRLRGMTVDVTVQTIEPTPTAVVAAATTWAEFPKAWGPMLDQVWSFLRGDAPAGLYQQGHNIMLYQDDVPHVEVAGRPVGIAVDLPARAGQPVPVRLAPLAYRLVRVAEPGDRAGVGRGGDEPARK